MSALEITLWKVSNLQYFLIRVDQLVLNKDKKSLTFIPGILVGSIFSFVDSRLSLYFFFWALCCLFFDIRILITPLVSSNSFYYKYGENEPTEAGLN
jgi:hypothetical protein